MHKKLFCLFLVSLMACFAAASGNKASTRFVVSIPEVLLLRINGQTGGRVPVSVSDGRVIPGILRIEVLANCGWRLTVRATPLEGPLGLPPRKIAAGGPPADGVRAGC